MSPPSSFVRPVSAPVHGDPFPLPDPGLRSYIGVRDAPRYVRQRLHAGRDRDCRLREACASLNTLSLGTVRSEALHQSAFAATPPSKTQRSVFSTLGRAIGAYGPSPADLVPRGALLELFKTQDLYEDTSCRVAPFDPEKLGVLHSNVEVKQVRSVAPPDIAKLFSHPNDFVRRSEEELDVVLDTSKPIRPYWDRLLLSSRATRIQLFRQLHRRGLVCFVRRIRSRLGVFFVWKKDDRIRMVLDCREVCRCHRVPPHTALGTPAALAEQQWSDDALSSAAGHAVESPTIYGASLDLKDSFYQFGDYMFASDFGVDFPEPASEYGCDSVLTDFGFEAAGPDDLVFPAFCVVPMGWTWALHIVHSIVTYQVGLCLTGGLARVLLDRQPPPVATLASPTASVYVDKITLMGLSEASVNRELRRINKALNHLGIDTHEVVLASDTFDTVGLRYLGRRRLLLHKPSRAWRLHAALGYAAKLPGLTGHQMQILLGHCTHHGMLNRSSLAIFCACYRFVDRARGAWRCLDAHCRAELSAFRALVLCAAVDLAKPCSDLVFCSDSSLQGYGVHVTRLPPGQVRELSACRERWRFVPEEKRPVALRSATFGPGRVADVGASALTSGPATSDISEPASGEMDLRRRLDSTHRVCVGASSDMVQPLPANLFQSSRWSLLVEGAWRNRTTIHVGEAKASLIGLRRASRTTSLHNHIVLSIGDNLSEIVASEKGRCADYSLRTVMLQETAYRVAAGIEWRRRHVPTKLNISDSSSRKAVRGVYTPGQRRVGAGSRFGVLQEKQFDHDVVPSNAPPITDQPPLSPSIVSPSPSSMSCSPQRVSPPSSPDNVQCDAVPQRSSASSGRLSPSSPANPRGHKLSHSTSAASPSSHVWRGSHRESRHVACPHLHTHRSLPHHTHRPLRRPLSSVPPSRRIPKACLEIFSGCARLTGALRGLGLPCVFPIDARAGRMFDITDRAVEQVIRKWITSGKIGYIHFGTPCTRWSIARRARTLDSARSLVGLQCAQFTLRMLRLCTQFGVRWSVENPVSSGLFRWSPLASFLQSHPHHRVVYHNCRFGAPYKKSTCIVTDIPGLLNLGKLCRGDHTHIPLNGRVETFGRELAWVTSLAGQYPPALCWQWAREVGKCLYPDRVPDATRPLERWIADLCAAVGCEAPADLQQPSCPQRWVPLWPADARWQFHQGPTESHPCRRRQCC